MCGLKGKGRIEPLAARDYLPCYSHLRHRVEMARRQRYQAKENYFFCLNTSGFAIVVGKKKQKQKQRTTAFCM